MESVQSNRDWEAESDARTLASAEAIRADAKRLAKAQKAAKKLSEEKVNEAKGMLKAAGRKPSLAGMLDYTMKPKKGKKGARR